MSWFKRIKAGITTGTREKKETPEGLWHKCTSCKRIASMKDHIGRHYVCEKCGYHERIGSKEYFNILFDENNFYEINAGLVSDDPLNFTDTKKYTERLEEAIRKTELHDAIRTAHGKVNEHELMIACMDFSFIGGSMGSVMGEKIARAVDVCLQKKIPLLVISKSGGARMMEAAYSLMQMAKTSAKLTLMSKEKIPYFSLMTDPTTGGVTASFAMLGDVNMAEPGALIGFAGPRIVKETIRKDLPKGFQTSEFVLEHGFLDFIIDRRELKARMSALLTLFKN
ncbi:MAG TPA: acetyl-CoA carboxylase, carboxyltransferase subunit beta [Bacteroidia bacterium]|nr:acetyl-CoA carboxylase, carboxyltransferase subunit beta [Bacteroidia bacterium]